MAFQFFIFSLMFADRSTYPHISIFSNAIIIKRQMQKGMSARTFLFSPGGPLAKELSRHGVILKVNDWLFAHGGVHPHHGMYISF